MTTFENVLHDLDEFTYYYQMVDCLKGRPDGFLKRNNLEEIQKIRTEKKKEAYENLKKWPQHWVDVAVYIRELRRQSRTLVEEQRRG